ncbi:hypothetical protein Bbelb_231820 [Branchiostoma belcheri]|nr:hypothetical protein Bbelb_231820 [Branchiostoma belcheri]
MSCGAQESPSTVVVLRDGLVGTTAKLTIENLDAQEKSNAPWGTPSDDIQTKTFEPSVPSSTTRNISQIEDSSEQISTVHIIIIALTICIAFIFIVAMAIKTVKLHRSGSSEEDDNSPGRDNIALQNISPPMLNTAYHGNFAAQQQQGSTAISLAQIVPPVLNAMYHGQGSTGLPQPAGSTQTCVVAQIIPPIENTAYHRSNAGTAQGDISLSQIVPPVLNAMYHRQGSTGVPRPPDSAAPCLAQFIPPIENTAYISNTAASSRDMSASVSEREADSRQLPSAASPHGPPDDVISTYENNGEDTHCYEYIP